MQIAEYTKTHFYSGHKKLSLVIYIHRFWEKQNCAPEIAQQLSVKFVNYN